jgi:adenylate cyclase
VAIGEVGTVKQEIAFLGDSMNVTARLQQACREQGERMLASASLIERIGRLPAGIEARPLGPITLRGKSREIGIVALRIAAPADLAVARPRGPAIAAKPVE